MIDSALLFCASGIILDKNANKVSAFEIVDDLKSKKFPVVFPRFEVLSILKRQAKDKNKLKGELIIKLDKEILINAPFDVDFQDKLSVRTIITINGLTINTPGTVLLELLVEGKKLGVYSFAMKQEKEVTIK